MIPSQISVSRLLELDVPLSWQEAVAIAGEVAVLRAAGPGLDYERVVIDADSCMLTTTGEIELPRSSVEQPDDVEVQLLRALLAGRTIPGDLEAVAYGPIPAHLGDALAAFSRPDRRSAIAAVAARGFEAEQELAAFTLTSAASAVPASVADELYAPVDGFDELRAQVAHSPDIAATKPVAPPPPVRRAPVPAGKIASAAAVFAIVSAGVWAWSAWQPVTPAEGANDAMAPALPVESRPSWLEAAGQRSTDIDLGRRRRARVTPSGTVVDDALVDGTALATPEVDDTGGSEAWLPIGDLAAPVSPAAPYERTAPGGGAANAIAGDGADDTVYSGRTSSVEPPSMRFPRMPRSAFPAPEAAIDGQYVEVLIDKAGLVEAVRLRGRPAPGQPVLRYGMILSAAKAWQFTPATLDGQPVRYVARVVLEQ